MNELETQLRFLTDTHYVGPDNYDDFIEMDSIERRQVTRTCALWECERLAQPGVPMSLEGATWIEAMGEANRLREAESHPLSGVPGLHQEAVQPVEQDEQERFEALVALAECGVSITGDPRVEMPDGQLVPLREAIAIGMAEHMSREDRVAWALANVPQRETGQPGPTVGPLREHRLKEATSGSSMGAVLRDHAALVHPVDEAVPAGSMDRDTADRLKAATLPLADEDYATAAALHAKYTPADLGTSEGRGPSSTRPQADLGTSANQASSKHQPRADVGTSEGRRSTKDKEPDDLESSTTASSGQGSLTEASPAMYDSFYRRSAPDDDLEGIAPSNLRGTALLESCGVSLRP
jgi:hypothetical protein